MVDQVWDGHKGDGDVSLSMEILGCSFWDCIGVVADVAENLLIEGQVKEGQMVSGLFVQLLVKGDPTASHVSHIWHRVLNWTGREENLLDRR